MIERKPTISKITATEVRQHFGKVIHRAYSRGEHLVVEKNDLPVVVILSVKDYEELRQKAALQNLDELNRSLSRQAQLQGLTPEKLEGRVEETKREIFEELYG
jgi:prevent-host-death family protein